MQGLPPPHSSLNELNTKWMKLIWFELIVKNCENEEHLWNFHASGQIFDDFGRMWSNGKYISVLSNECQ